MTLNTGEVKAIIREYPMFSLWAIRNGTLFLPKIPDEDTDDEGYDLASQIYIMMKRLRQPYSELLLMDSEEREWYFNMELKLINKESEESKNG